MKGADIEKRAQSSLLNAEAHYRSGSYYHAKRYLRVALKLCRGDALKRAQSYNMLGLIASRSSSAQERKWTKRYFDLAEDAMRGSLAERDLITRSNIRLNRAIVFKNEGQFDRARRELDSASRDAKQAGGIAEITRIEEVRGMLWCWQVKRALERNDKKYMALAFLKGKKNFVKALSLAEDLGDTVSVARILNNLCLLHLEMPTTKALLRYAHEANDRAVALSMERGDSHELAKRLAMKGYVFQKANDWDSALSFYREALPNLVDVLPRGACLRDMAVCSFQLGNASAARKLIRESSKILPSGPELEQTMKVLSEIDQAPLIKT